MRTWCWIANLKLPFAPFAVHQLVVRHDGRDGRAESRSNAAQSIVCLYRIISAVFRVCAAETFISAWTNTREWSDWCSVWTLLEAKYVSTFTGTAVISMEPLLTHKSD